MFGFGFTVVFMCSGQWGLPLSKATRFVMLATCVTIMLCNYGLGWSAKFGNEPVAWKDMNEVTRIPSLYYIVMALYFVFYCGARFIHKI